MAAGRGKDLVAFGAVIAAACFGTWLVIRTQLDLGAGWTDGTERYEAVRGERIRYAIWDDPLPLGGDVNAEEAESRPAISPDGRWLVFAVGTRGLNADLWVAELVAGEPRDPRPLGILNSVDDELAPAFASDTLFFASDRGGPTFGLDLFRASFSNGVFGPPEPIGSGINTTADETDPYPVPGSRELLFASNRERGRRTDFDLYRARVDSGAATDVPGAAENAAAYVVEPIEALNTPFEEREPALTSDGRTLIFASDRGPVAQNFDLYRAFFEEEEWLPAEPLIGVNTEESERGPLLSADGFSLFFDVSRGERASDLWLAHSKELFRIPAPPLSIEEILVLLLLLLLAILAWLSKRWRAIDILYKCFLVSLLIHLAMMWYLREVYPESEPVALDDSEQTFRVRLASEPSGAPSTARERGGELELTARTVEASESAPSRAESGLELAAAAPSRTELATPERTLEAPARRDADLGERRNEESPAPSMQEREAEFERLNENAPGLAINARETVAAPTESETSSPNRASTTSDMLAAAPSTRAFEASRDSADSESANPGPARLTTSMRTEVANDTSVAQPRETFESSRAEAPTFDLPEATVADAPVRQTGSAARHRADVDPTPYESSEARPGMSQLAHRAPEPKESTPPVGPIMPSLEALAARGDPSVAMRNVHEAPAADDVSRESVRFDATADLAQSSTSRSQPASSDPTRFDVSPERVATSDATPAQRQIEGLRPQDNPDSRARETPRVSALSPSAPSAADTPAVAVRAVAEDPLGEGPEVVAPKRFDPTAGLARSEPRRFRPTTDTAPTPRRFDLPSAKAPAQPSFAPTIVAAEPEEVALDDRRAELEHTPYKNRFGNEKLRALEEYGGDEETERAVALGLEYLAGIQELGGHWGSARDFDDKYRDVRIGKTALALLAFLGAGHTPSSNTEYSEVTDKALLFLLGVQHRPNGHFGDTSSYGHGIATYAIAECFALTQDERLEDPLRRGVARVLDRQATRRDPAYFGGWGYFFQDDSIWNGDTWPRVSVTAWQVMALESAKIGGLTIPDRAFENAQEFLLNAWDSQRAAFRYSHDPRRLRGDYAILPASTPAALFALSLFDIDVSREELAPARRFVLRRAPTDYSYTSDDDFVHRARGNLYFWYYATLAMFRVGGADWERWNAAMKETLIGGQSDDGSWRPISIYAREFAGDDDDDRAYSTAMCVLTLEIYYRYFTPLLSTR